MTQILELRHEVKQTFDTAKDLGSQTLSLAPLPLHGTNLLSQSLWVDPKPKVLKWVDAGQMGRRVHLVFDGPVKTLTIINRLKVSKGSKDPDRSLRVEARQFPFHYDATLQRDLSPFSALPKKAADLIEVLRHLPRESMATQDALTRLMQEVEKQAKRQAPEQALCRIPIHLAVLVEQSKQELTHLDLLSRSLRALHLAARFVLGYDLRAKGNLKIWLQTYLPGVGWQDLDRRVLVNRADLIALAVAVDLKTLAEQGLWQGQQTLSLSAIPEQSSQGLLDRDLALPTYAQEESESMTRAAMHLDEALKGQGLGVASYIEVPGQTLPFSKVLTYPWSDQVAKNDSWAGLLEDLEEKQKSAVPHATGRLHNLHLVKAHEPSIIDAQQVVARAMQLHQAFPCLMRLVGLDRFEGPYVKAQAQALSIQELDARSPRQAKDAWVLKTRHDLLKGSQVLPNALLERLILLRMADSRARFAPRAQALLDDTFRLPTLLWADLETLCLSFSDPMIQLEPSWFLNHLNKRYPYLWSHQLGDEKGPNLKIRSAYQAQHERHLSSMFEVQLSHDLQDRYEIGIDGWLLPLRRQGQVKFSGLELPLRQNSFRISLFDKQKRQIVLCKSLTVSLSCYGLDLHEDEKLLQVGDMPRLRPAPSHPDRSHMLCLDWAQHWGGT